MAKALVMGIQGYLAVGALVGLAFVALGARRFSHGGSLSWGFRAMIWPASAVLWPVVLIRWLAGHSSPTAERPE